MTTSTTRLIQFSSAALFLLTVWPAAAGVRCEATPGAGAASVQGCIDGAPAGEALVVYLPPGRYSGQTIRLKSDVMIELAAGAELDARIRGDRVRNIAIVGHDRKTSMVRGSITLNDSRKVVMRDFNEEGGGGQDLSRCTDVTMTGVTVRQRPQRHGGGSAMTIYNARDFFVSQCDLQSNDDVFCLKGSAENVHLSRTVLTGNLAAPFKIGTETDGVFRNISMTDCTIKDSDRGAISIESVDGADIDGVYISGIRMINVATPFFIRLGDRQRYGKSIGSLRNIVIRDVDAVGMSKDDGIGSAISGLAGHPVENVRISRLHAVYRGGGSATDAQRTTPEQPAAYPDYDMFGKLPAYGIFARHVKGLILEDVDIGYATPDLRPSLIAEDVEDLTLDGFTGMAAPGAEASIRLDQVRNVSVRRSVVPLAAPFVRVLGDRSDNITLAGNRRHLSSQPPVLLPDEFRGTLRAEPVVDPVVERILPAPVQPGKAVDITVTLRNPGDGAYAPVDLTVDGAFVERRWFWLAAGVRRELSLRGPAFYRAGVHSVAVNSVTAQIVATGRD